MLDQPSNLPVPVDPRGRNSKENGFKGGRKARAQYKQRFQIHERVKSGTSPLDTMLNNMDYWVDKADNLTEHVDETLDLLKNAAPEQLADMLKELNNSMKGMMAARDNAQKCAVEAAPYCHARLASITMEPAPPQPKVAAVKAGLTAKDAAVEYEQRLRNASRV